jgi:uncharacterized Tic20 family protein
MWALPAAWLVMMIVALLKHRAGKMVIMYNLTDAAVTLGTFLTPVISMWIFKGSYGREVDPETKDYIVYAVTALVMLFLAVCSVRISIAKNPGPATMALSVIVKFTLSAMVVILLFGRLSKKSAGRRGGEGGLAYGPGAPGQRVGTAFLLALALALFYMMIKSKEFSGLSDCFAREPLPEGD